MSGLMYEIESKGLSVGNVRLTPESIRELMVNVAKDTHMQGREFVVLSGGQGNQMLTDSIEKEAFLMMLETSRTKYSIEEYVRLKGMIESPDRENFEIAKLIMKNKK